MKMANSEVVYLFTPLLRTPKWSLPIAAALALSISTAAAARSDVAPYAPIQTLIGFDDAHGVVVCDPVATDQSMADFGRGCSAWLELSIGGRPEFGCTPPISELPRAMREMGQTDLAVDSSTATSLSHIAGVTDAVVGTIDGSTDHCTLTYQVYALPAGQARGVVVTASGSVADIAAQLPRIATALLKNLDGSKAPVPANGLTPGELSLIGRLWNVYDPGYVDDGEYTAIGQLAPRSTLAALLYLRFNANTSQTQARIAVASICRHTPDNLMALEEAYALAPGEMKGQAARIKQHRRLYPRNYLAALTSTWLARSVADESGIRTSAQDAVRCAPNDPYSWETLSEAMSNDAVALRHGRPIESLSKPERQTLSSLYVLGVASLHNAVAADPLDGSAWLHLSIAAAFSGDPRLAGQAYMNALTGKVDRYAAYSWALQMYGRQWYNIPSQLSTVVAAAKSATFDNDSETIAMASDLRAAGFSDDANALLAGAIATTEDVLRANPADGYAYWRLAAYCRAVGNNGLAIGNYREAEQYVSHRPDLFFTTGLTYDAAGRYADAVVEYRKAVKADPMYEDAHACLGQDLLSLGHIKDAAVEIERTVALDPSEPAAHYGRARLLYARGDVHGGDVEFRRAINLSAGSIDMYYQICWTLDAGGHYQPCLKYAREALRLHPRTLPIMEQAADAYLNLKDIRDAIRLLQTIVQINAGDSWAHEKLGEALEQTGDRGSARTEWQTALSLGDQAVSRRAQEMLAKYPP